jgi:hypothetical protein
VESQAPGRLRCSDAAFRFIHAVGFHDDKLSRLCHTAWITRCLRFAVRVTPVPRKTRFRLLAKLYRAVHIGLLGPLRKVSTVYLTSFPPFPGFAWRKDEVFAVDSHFMAFESELPQKTVDPRHLENENGGRSGRRIARNSYKP